MVFKRGNVYWYKFYWTIKNRDEKAQFFIRKSARTSNRRGAEVVEAEHKRALRLGEIHPVDEWPNVPTPEAPSLKEFSDRFLNHAKLHVKESSHVYYQTCVNRLLEYRDLAHAPIHKINGELVARYSKARTSGKDSLSVNSVNGDLRTLRRMLRLAYEWEVIARCPVIHELPGAKSRDRVITFEEEARYLSAASPTLRTLTILAANTGLRPNSELFLLEWKNVELEASELAPNGFIKVPDGKTRNAMRTVLLTPRAQEVLMQQKQLANGSRFVFPGPGNSGHLVTIQHPHERALKNAKIDAFEFYCWRHTFGTRCAQSGMDRFTLAKLMGHSSPRVTERYYIHITESHVSFGFEKFVAYQIKALSASGLEISTATQ